MRIGETRWVAGELDIARKEEQASDGDGVDDDHDDDVDVVDCDNVDTHDDDDVDVDVDDDLDTDDRGADGNDDGGDDADGTDADDNTGPDDAVGANDRDTANEGNGANDGDRANDAVGANDGDRADCSGRRWGEGPDDGAVEAASGGAERVATLERAGREPRDGAGLAPCADRWRPSAAGDEPAEDESPFGPEVESIASSLGILRRLGGRRAAAQAAELPAREYAVAEVVDLVASRGYSSAGEVAATLGLAQSRASLLVRRARDARWLDAERGPWDTRVTVLSVTREGRALVELMQADRCATVDRATVFWAEQDRLALAHLLERLADAVERPYRW